MPNLDAPTSIFNLDNRGLNASLDIARNTYNQVLTNMNWESNWYSYQPTIEAASTSLDNSRAVEVVSVLPRPDAGASEISADYDIFYTTDSYRGGESTNSYLPRTLWFYNGETEIIDITRYLPSNNASQQVIDIIGVRSDQYLYFTREISSSALNESNYNAPTPRRFELWKTNGKQTETQLVKSWEQVLGGKKDNLALTESSIVGDRIYINFGKGRTEQPGYEVWESQGTTETTLRLDHLSNLVQRSVPGLGKITTEQAQSYSYITDPRIVFQGYGSNENYFTLESAAIDLARPGAQVFYEVWKVDRTTNQLTKIGSLNDNSRFLPKDFLSPYLPNTVNRNVQGNYSPDALAENREFGSYYYQGTYYFSEDGTSLSRRNDQTDDVKIVDFSSIDRLASLRFGGELAIPYGTASSTDNDGETRLYFTRSNSTNFKGEIWVVDRTGEDLQKVFETQLYGNIRGVYKVSNNHLVVMTNQGIQSLKINAKKDAIAQLVNGDYRALKQLAYEIGGDTLAQEVSLPDFDTSSYNLIGIKDLDGDGDVDLLFQHKTTQQLAFWQMKGLAYETGFLAPDLDYSGWTVRSTVDLDRDGDLDFIWQHDKGNVATWKMKGMQLEAASLLGPSVNPNEWLMSGVGDLDGNQKLEIFWRNVDGRLGIWEIDNFQLSRAAFIPDQLDAMSPDSPQWKVQALSDLDGDGDGDLLLTSKDGQVAIWEMQDGNLKKGFYLPTVNTTFENERPTPKFRATRYGGQFDLKQDGTIDLWWHSGNTGRWEAWRLKKTPQGLEFDLSLTAMSVVL